MLRRRGVGRQYMSSELSILIVEDQALDAELLEHELRRIGLKFNSLRVYARSKPVSWDQCFG